MATHSSSLAWEMPRTEKLGGLQSMGSQRVGHNLATKPPLGEDIMLNKVNQSQKDKYRMISFLTNI